MGLVVNISRMVQEIDFDAFFARLDLTESAASKVDPVAYAESVEQIQTMRQLALALQKFKLTVQKITKPEEERKIIIP